MTRLNIMISTAWDIARALASKIEQEVTGILSIIFVLLITTEAPAKIVLYYGET